MSDAPNPADAASKVKDPTSIATDKAIDKLTNRKESDGAAVGAAKDTVGGAAKGALQGAKAGGAHGAAIGAAKGAAEALIKNKKSRNVLIAVLVFLLTPSMMMGIAMLGIMNMGTGHAEEFAMEAAGTKASGIEEDEAQAIKRAAIDTGVQWPVLFALYKIQNTTNTMAPEVAPNHDGGGTQQLASGDGFSLGDKCDPWATKVGEYLHKHWGNNQKGVGTIGCQREDHDSDHNSGNALDYMTKPHDEQALGNEVATFLMKNAKALSIKYLIWEQKIWNPSKDPYGKWRDMKSRGTITADHFDHIHISFQHPGKDGDKTAGTPGTYDFPEAKPEITEADIKAAFGGEGSGGAVPGYEDNMSSGVATSGRPFGINDDADGAPEDNVEGETEGDRVYRHAVYIANKLKASLDNNSNYRGEDIGTGLAVNSEAKQIYPVAADGQVQRDRIQQVYTEAFNTLPVDGAGNDQWANNVWSIAVSLRMGLPFDVCEVAPPVADPAAPAPEASPSPSASASPSAAPTMPSTLPGATTPAAPPNVKLPFKVTPSAPYPGAKSVETHAVNVNEAILKNVAIVSAVAKELFPDPQQYERAMVIAVATMLVETGGTNDASKAVPESLQYPHDAVSQDHDSVGIFQQRVYVGYYGTAQQLMDPAYQAYMFFGAPKPLHGPLPKGVARRGLLQYGKPGNDISSKSKGKNWMNEPIGEVAQTIQGSAHPERYELWVRDAPKVIEAATGISVNILNPGGCVGGMDSIGGGGSMGIKPASGKMLSPIPDNEKGIIMSARYGHYPKGGKHFGVDLARGKPWQVQAVCDGTIKAIKINPRYANTNAYKVSGSTNYLWQDCGNGVLIGYAHFFARDLNSDLKEGMMIGAGTPLFPEGNQGNSSGYHLHLQISTSNSMSYTREATVDPVAYLAQFGISLPKANY